jgi:hypothetical protein
MKRLFSILPMLVLAFNLLNAADYSDLEDTMLYNAYY